MLKVFYFRVFYVELLQEIEKRIRGNSMSNEELVYLIKSGTDVADNMLQLWKQTEAFVYSIAKKYIGHAELEDLLQEGYLSLYDAVDGYDRQRCDSLVH